MKERESSRPAIRTAPAPKRAQQPCCCGSPPNARPRAADRRPGPRLSRTPLAWVLALPVRAYRLIGSPWVGRNCRFQPTCSEYALEALERHGALRGGWLALWRILRCNPFGGQGFDPVPPVRARPENRDAP